MVHGKNINPFLFIQVPKVQQNERKKKSMGAEYVTEKINGLIL